MLTKYKTLLEGFCDDERFKDMIPYVVKESQTSTGPSVKANDGPKDIERDNDKLQQRMKRKETKGFIPNLEKDDRPFVLPLIVKLCSSKIKPKKGVINKKNIMVRRNIIYNLFSTFDP